jgi:hypothetical protein
VASKDELLLMENAVLTWQHQVDVALNGDPDALLRQVHSHFATNRATAKP